MLAVCQEIPRACATRETDMDSRPKARSPHSTAARVSRARGWATRLVSCLHTRQQCAQAKRRTTSCVGLHPTGRWASRLATVPRATPWAPQALQNGSSKPAGMRHSITARPGVRCCPIAVSPRASRPRNVVRSGPVKVVSGTSRSLVTECVGTPIIGGPRPPPTATTHPPPPPNRSIGPTYYTLKHEEPHHLHQHVGRVRLSCDCSGLLHQESRGVCDGRAMCAPRWCARPSTWRSEGARSTKA